MAAKQSGRDIIPRVENIKKFERRITKNKRHKR